MSLSIRVGDRHITHLAEDLQFSWGLHGPASCTVRFRDKITRQLFPAFEHVWVYDHKAETQYEGRLEDPGRSVDGEGQVWALSAVGEQARASDRTAPLIYIDRDLSRWLRVRKERATSADAAPSDLPSSEGTDCLLFQYNPGQPIDSTASVDMQYAAIEEAGMLVGGIEYTAVAGRSAGSMEYRLFCQPSDTHVRLDLWDTVPVSRFATLSDATPLVDGTTAVELRTPRNGGATNIGSDDWWAGFYDIAVKAVRLNLDGTLDTINSHYWEDRGVYPHEVVIDLLARLLTGSYDVPNADVDTSSTYQINQFAFPDGVTAAQVLDELMKLQPEFYWQVQPDAGGKTKFAWRKWPTHVRYEASMGDGLDLPGNDAEMFNEVVVRWKDKRGRIRILTRTANVPALDNAGLVRTGYIDLSDEVGSQDNAARAGDAFLAEHATPPVAATLTVARRIYDHDLGRMVEPYEIRPGHLLRIRELGNSAADLQSKALPERFNECINPSFEVDTFGWQAGDTGVGQSTILRSQGDARSGSSYLYVEANYADRDAWAESGPDGIVPVTVGETYTASVHVRAEAGSRPAFMNVRWLDSAGAIVGSVNGSNVAMTIAWQRLSLTGTAPAGATHLQMEVAMDAPGSVGDAIGVDAVLIERSATAGRYGDGTTDGWVWQGTPHKSPSRRLPMSGADGKCVFRVMGVEYRHSTRAATVELDAPPKTDEATVAALVSKRERKR